MASPSAATDHLKSIDSKQRQFDSAGRAPFALLSAGYGSVCADQVPGTAYPLFQAFVEAGQLDGHVSRGHGTNVTTPSASGVEFLYQAIGLTSDRELVSRLAYLWGMSPEVLGSTAGTLASLLEPCGRDTTPHALWVSDGLVSVAAAVSAAHLSIIQACGTTSCASCAQHVMTPLA